MENKTIGEWFNTLPEPIRSKALANTKNHLLLNSEQPDLCTAIKKAFIWEGTPEDEGHYYWGSVSIGINPETGEKLILDK